MARRRSMAQELVSLVNALQVERQQHVDAMTEIDGTLERFGIRLPSRKRRGRPPGSRKVAKKRAAKTNVTRKGKGRKHFATTGPESILGFVKKAGAKGVPGAEIVKNWNAEGRGAGAYVIVGKLVKAKKLKKEKIKGGQGSRYTVA